MRTVLDWYLLLEPPSPTSPPLPASASTAPATSTLCDTGDEEADDGFRVFAEEDESAGAAVAAAAAAQLAPRELAPRYWREQYVKSAGRHWEAFYQSNGDRFFRDRHYLSRDFQAVRSPARGARDMCLLEVGCGCGNALLPLAQALPRLHVAAFDLSRVAIDLASAQALQLGLRGRVHCFVRDAAVPDLAADVERERRRHRSALEAEAAPATAEDEGYSAGFLPRKPALVSGFDAVLMLFMLSAMPPERHLGILAEAASTLTPGGALLFRDYAFGDAAQLRFGKGKMLDTDGSLFVRQDGTLAYFFTLGRLRALCAAAGLEEVESRVLVRSYTNRAENVTLRRLFVHGVFRKGVGIASGPL